MKRSGLRTFLIVGASMAAGIAIGGYLFSTTKPRSFLAIKQCDNCLSATDLAGLVASVGIQKFPGFVPSVVLETDKSIVITHPFPKTKFHFVIIPKKDIKDVGDISEADAPYLIDAYLVARQLIEKEKLVNYRLFTNGPGYQAVTYLHFHLVAKQ